MEFLNQIKTDLMDFYTNHKKSIALILLAACIREIAPPRMPQTSRLHSRSVQSVAKSIQARRGSLSSCRMIEAAGRAVVMAGQANQMRFRSSLGSKLKGVSAERLKALSNDG